MNLTFQSHHPDFVMPRRGTSQSAGYDIFMPDAGYIPPQAARGVWVDLGFATALPPELVALLLPRSGRGTKQGLMLNNSVGVMDADFRGQWRACLRCLNDVPIKWDAGDCILQFLLQRVEHPSFLLSDTLPDSERGEGGFGSTGK